MKHSAEWKKKESEIKVLETNSDTFYSSTYKGSVVSKETIKFWEQKFEEIKSVSGKSVLSGQFTGESIKNDQAYLEQVFRVSAAGAFPYSELTEEEIPVGNLTEVREGMMGGVGEPDPVGVPHHAVRGRAGRQRTHALRVPVPRDEGRPWGAHTARTASSDSSGTTCAWTTCSSGSTTRGSTTTSAGTTCSGSSPSGSPPGVSHSTSYRVDAIKAKGFSFDTHWSINPQQSFIVQQFVDVKHRESDKVYFRN